MTSKEKINELVKEELQEANKLHPMFHSAHEAYAVIKEELEEAESEIHACNEELDFVWEYTRWDEAEKIRDHLHYLMETAIKAIGETIQVAAMCDKALHSMDIKAREEFEKEQAN